MKASVITTILNEEETIVNFLDSLYKQSKKIDELVIVDGGSKDATCQKILKYKDLHTDFPIRLMTKKGNRSIGRNEAIRNATHDIIAIIDAGCIANAHWFKNIISPFQERADVVAGWYQPIQNTVWDRALSKVLNFSLEQVDPNKFLPSTRSMALQKKAWKQVSGFDEQLSHNEDTPFSIKLHNVGFHFSFAKNAVVYWRVPQDIKSLYKTIYRYALGDAQSKIYSFHYKLIGIFWLAFICSFIIGFLFPISFLIGTIIVLAYLYLPFFQSKKISSSKELYLIPLQKMTIIVANTLGFTRGLFQKV